MEHKEGRFSGHKNLNLYYQCWLPANRPKVILLVVHGMGEHSGWYFNLADYFVPKGYSICSFDLRGHGKSEGLRGYVERFENYLDDLETFLNLVRGKYRDAKIFLVGHSMGGLIATAYTINHKHELTGLILSGAALKVGSSWSSMLIPIAKVLSLVMPKFGIPSPDASGISRDKAVVEDILHDPLCYWERICVRLGTELVKAMKELRHLMSDIRLPILIMHGTDDCLSDPEGSKMLYEGVSSRDKSLKLYVGFYHKIFNEPGHKQVFADMEEWLATHI